MPSLLSPAKIAKAVEASREQLKWTREQYARNKQELAGRHYAEGDKVKRPRNLIAESNLALRPYLARRCEIKIVPVSATLGEAYVLERKLELERRRLRMQELERRAVEAALITPSAVVRIGHAASEQRATVEEHEYTESETCVELVAWENWAQDPAALSPSAIRWEGDRYDIVRSAAVEYQVFGNDPEDLAEMPPELAGMVMTKEEALTAIGGAVEKREGAPEDGEVQPLQPDTTDAHDLVRTVQVWRVAVYDLNGETWIVHFLAQRPDTEKFLKAEKFVGTRRGPYEKLTFIDIPGEAVGLPYSTMLMDLHESARILSEKMITDAEEAKTVVVARKGQEDTANRFVKAANWQCITGEPDGITTLDTKPRFEFYQPAEVMVNGWAQNLGGNTQTLGGTGKIADTATESTILAGNAQQRLQDMLDAVTDFRMRIAEAMLFYELQNPLVDDMVPVRQPMGEIELVHNDAARRTTTALEAFEVQVEVDQDYATDVAIRRKQDLEFFATLQQHILPLMQMGFDPGALTRYVGNRFGMDNLDSLLTNPAMLPGSPMAGGGMGMKGPVGAGPGTPGAGTRPVDAARGAMAAAVPQGVY